MYFPIIHFKRGNRRYSCPSSALDKTTLFYCLGIVNDGDDYGTLDKILRLEENPSGNSSKFYLDDIEIESDEDVITALVLYIKGDDFPPPLLCRFLDIVKIIRRDYIYFSYTAENIEVENPYLASIQNSFILERETEAVVGETSMCIDTTTFLVGMGNRSRMFTIMPTYPESISGEIILECFRSIQERVDLGINSTVNEKYGSISILLNRTTGLNLLLNNLIISVNEYMELPPSKNKSAAK